MKRPDLSQYTTQQLVDELLIRRFFSFVNQNGPIPEHRPELGACWLWTKKPDKEGYARIQYESRPTRAHVFAYEKFVGSIPSRLVIDHLCRVRHCVNPKHLEAVTRRENNLRGASLWARQSRRTHCIHGHLLAGSNLYVVKTKQGNERRQCRKCRSTTMKKWWRSQGWQNLDGIKGSYAALH